MSQDQKETPLVDGLLPSQVRCLLHPIHEQSVHIHPYFKWPYVPGPVIINHLNKIFGFAGWELFVKRLEIGEPISTQDGKWKLIAWAHITLRVHTPGGRSVDRDGFGSLSNKSSNLEDVYGVAPAGAITNGLKNACATWGHQGGLAVLRVAKAMDVDWRRLAAKTVPPWPEWLGLETVQLADGSEARVDEVQFLDDRTDLQTPVDGRTYQLDDPPQGAAPPPQGAAGAPDRPQLIEAAKEAWGKVHHAFGAARCREAWAAAVKDGDQEGLEISRLRSQANEDTLRSLVRRLNDDSVNGGSA